MAAEAIPPPFDPYHCLYGAYPTFPVSSLPTIRVGSNNSYVGYAMAVLHCKAGQPCTPHALPGPWYFGTGFKGCVMSFQTFFGLYVDGVIGPQTWGTIQYVVNNV